MSLLVVGSIAFDSIYTPKDKGEEILGGSAVHFTSASSFFTPTSIVGVVGSDFNMSELDFLKKRATDLSGIYAEEGKTFRWTGKYHDNMNDRDTLVTELNVFENFKPNIPQNLRDVDYLFLANINPDLQLDVLDQVNRPEFTALDTMNFWIDGARPALEKVLSRVNCVILNDSEAVDFSGTDNLMKAAIYVAGFGPEYIIIKKGEHGSLLYHDDTFFLLPAYLLENVIDPTGAGDSFAGGFMGYIAQQKKHDVHSIRTAMAIGTITASFCCEDFGSSQFMKLDKKSIENRLDTFRKMTSY